jgi:hypothetical protein
MYRWWDFLYNTTWLKVLLTFYDTHYTLPVDKTIVAIAYYRHDIVTIKLTLPITVTLSAGRSQLVTT